MLVSVGLNRLEGHGLLLREELREAEIMLSQLNDWYQTSVSEEERAFISTQLRVMKKERRNIRNRISLLESMEEQFSELKHTVEERMADAGDSLKALYFDGI